MKILIIAFYPKSWTVHSLLYEKLLKRYNVYYDIVFWDRFNNGEIEINGNEYIIHRKCPLDGNKFNKILPMLYYRKIVKKLISENKYKKLIVLNTLTGIVISDMLLEHFKNNYVFDIRDHTYENYTLYKKRVNKLIKNSFMTSISSKGFLSFLENKEKIYVNHNISNENKTYNADLFLANKGKVVIGYVGFVRYKAADELILTKLKNNKKYCLKYIGYQPKSINLREFANNNNINNVVFKDAFENKDKPVIYETIDFINSYYGNGTPEVDTLLSNRLYDCLVFKKPIIVAKHTYMGKIVEKYNLGIAISKDDDLKTKLDNFIKNFNAVEFEKTTNMLLKIVANDQKKIVEKLKEFIK